MIVGGIIQAIIFGNVAILIQTMGEARKRLENKLDVVQEFLTFHGLPENLTQKAMDAIEYSWNYSQVCKKKEIDRSPIANDAFEGNGRSFHFGGLPKGLANRSHDPDAISHCTRFQRIE